MLRTFLDTNVFLYAAGADHPIRDPCRRVLQRVAEGTLDAVTSSEVVQELLHVLVRRGRRADALRLARDVVALFPDLLPVGREEMEVAADLLERLPQASVRDAVHAATMRTNGVAAIVTVDAHFDAFPGVRRVDPADAAPDR